MIVSLNEVANLIPGFAFKSTEFRESPNHVIKIGDIDKEIYANNLPCVDISSYDKTRLEKFRCREGDHVIAMTGNTIGKVGRVTEGSAYANQRVLKVTPKPDVVTEDYLACILASPSLQNHIINFIDSHSAQPNISANSIGKYQFGLPSINIQKQRASLIANINLKIMFNNRLNDYLAA